MNIAPSYFSPSSSPSPPLLPDSIHPSSNPNLKIAYSNSSDQQSSQDFSSSFNGPYMGVVLVVLLVTFFLMAAFSVYVRRYAFSLSGDVEYFGPAGQGRGLDRAAIDGLPIVVYHCKKEETAAAVAPAQAHEWSRRPDCVVCLTDFQEAEKVRLLPRCEHCFHPECIDMWLCSHSTCPLCRRSLLPPLPPSNDVCISVQAPPLAEAPSDSNRTPTNNSTPANNSTPSNP